MFQQAPMSPIFDVRCVHRPNSNPPLHHKVQGSYVKIGFFYLTSCWLAKTGFLPVIERRHRVTTQVGVGL